jgi:hypothetical protein
MAGEAIGKVYIRKYVVRISFVLMGIGQSENVEIRPGHRSQRIVRTVTSPFTPIKAVRTKYRLCGMAEPVSTIRGVRRPVKVPVATAAEAGHGMARVTEDPRGILAGRIAKILIVVARAGSSLPVVILDAADTVALTTHMP